MKRTAAILAFLLCTSAAFAQNYTAINGSSYTGSLNVHNNPAAIVNSPLKWDVTLFGLQEKHTTNSLTIRKYSLLSKPANAEIVVPAGIFRRYGDVNLNINLLNARIALNKRNALAFGANLKAYGMVKTSPTYLSDSMGFFARYFLENEGITDIDYKTSVSSWAEVYLSYGRMIADNENGRLNAGITLKLNKGLAGGFGSLADVRFTRTGTNPSSYELNSAAVDFGYSAGYDQWDEQRSVSQNLRDLVAGGRNSASLDIGFEYLVKLQTIPSAWEDESFYDYDWKIGLSVLDIGYARYPFGAYSTRARALLPGITDERLDQTLNKTFTDLQELRDSLALLYDPISTYTGDFGINHPARVVLNIDKFITDAFFVNADVSFDLSTFSKRLNQPVRDLNLVTLTGRWETRKKGFYLPVYYNNRNQLWVGSAVRVGPLLFGVHNWGNFFTRNKTHRGGFYLAFILKAADYTGSRYDRRLNCPGL
ncbi:MAG: hypothetical protein ABW019_02520 [Chitinophagaceae bacterium]